MKHHNEKQYNNPKDQDYYGTGSTQPPKDRGGLVAILLVAVILLGGTSSALGIINLHLLSQLSQQQEPLGTLNVFDPYANHSCPTPIGESADSISFSQLDLDGQTVSDFDRRFYHLPHGVLVTDVYHSGIADQAGIHAGDVIIRLGDHTIQTQGELEAALENCPAATAIEVEFYRHQTGETRSTSITLPED